jgi:hypothetical protein
MQDLNFTPMNSPSATDTMDGSTCESLQSLEIRITALDWIMLLRYMVSKTILEFCQNKKFCRPIYVTAHSHSMSNKLHSVTWYNRDTVASPEGNTSLIRIEVYDSRWFTISAACSVQLAAVHKHNVTDVVSVQKVVRSINRIQPSKKHIKMSAFFDFLCLPLKSMTTIT